MKNENISEIIKNRIDDFSYDKNENIVIHKNQSTIDDFLKVENKECLDCLECEDNTCNSITCDYFGVSILDISESFCIHKRTDRQFDDTPSLF